ncbi:MAG: cytochrome c3 family protein [Armatimonadota bacterium]
MMNTWHSRSLTTLWAALMIAVALGAYYVGTAYSDAGTAGAATTAKPAATPKATYVGTDTCVMCHEDTKAPLDKHFHGQAMAAKEKAGKGYLCEGCHGPGSAHAEDPGETTATPLKRFAQQGTGCLQCHNTRISHAKWQRSAHRREKVGCIGCHGEYLMPAADQSRKAQRPDSAAHKLQKPVVKPHEILNRTPSTDNCLVCHGEKRAEMAMPSHHPVKENRITCADCHDPHGPQDEKMKRDVCVTCHAKQHGPFRYEHAAITAGRLTDACVSCHRPHGSPNRKLLKFSNRGLCLQCHADKVTHFPGRLCWDCHRQVHGSNNNQRFFN